MKRVIKRIMFALAFVALLAVGILVVMWLWNSLIPSIIGWSAITYWQAAGLMILSRLLFGGFGGGRHRRHKGPRHFWKNCDKRQHHGMHGEWHKKMHDEMKGMSREERRDFIRQRMREEHENHHRGCDRHRGKPSDGNEPHHDHNEDAQQ